MLNATAESLAERLLTSRLISAEQLADAVAAVGEEDDPLLGHLVETGLLTGFQEHFCILHLEGDHHCGR